ncbi:MAG TPA: hypothetical protein VHA52_11200 [Candidatus Babeliaceae bacterium]|nr:hypothetical protein [Candidatus Babeliaceae bacterium]
MVFKKNVHGIYSRYPQIEPANLSLIQMFVDDVSVSIDYILDILDSKQNQETAMNSCYLKKEGFWVTIGFLYCDEGEEWEAKLPAKELVKLIVKWQKLKKDNADYIVFTQEGETYDLVGGDKSETLCL